MQEIHSKVVCSVILNDDLVSKLKRFSVHISKKTKDQQTFEDVVCLFLMYQVRNQDTDFFHLIEYFSKEEIEKISHDILQSLSILEDAKYT